MTDISLDPLTDRLKQCARDLGFSEVGVTPAIRPTGWSRFQEWLAAGYAGKMDYLVDRAAAYEDPRHVLDQVRSIVMLAMPYRTSEPVETQPGQGRVSRYAWGSADYHDWIRPRLRTLADLIRAHAPDAAARGVVDTAPLLEREFAQLAGLGWIGKNTLLLNKQAGSWFFLAALLTDQTLRYDTPFETDHCGTCTACLDACPTDAFPQPYVLDATRCVSYLTIELSEAVPEPLRSGLGDWLFGCDVCQDVCPWNRPRAGQPERPVQDLGQAESVSPFVPVQELNPVELAQLFELDDATFRRRFRRTPLWRARRRGLLRSAAILLGNRPTPPAIRPLVRGLTDCEPLVRAASAWALGRQGTSAASAALSARQGHESDSEVLREIAAALG